MRYFALVLIAGCARDAKPSPAPAAPVESVGLTPMPMEFPGKTDDDDTLATRLHDGSLSLLPYIAGPVIVRDLDTGAERLLSRRDAMVMSHDWDRSMVGSNVLSCRTISEETMACFEMAKNLLFILCRYPRLHITTILRSDDSERFRDAAIDLVQPGGDQSLTCEP